MQVRQNPVHPVQGAPTYLMNCPNCRNAVDSVLVYCKEGTGVSPPIVGLFTDRLTLMPKVHYLRCPICANLTKVQDDVVAILTPEPCPANGWHPDPSARHERRFWDGAEWTVFVGDGNRVSINKLDGA